MKKFSRLVIVLVVVITALLFLLPSIQWYYITPKDQQTLALGSRDQIREYSWKMARVDFQKIENLFKSNNENPLPEDLSYVIPIAKKAYRLYKKPLPQVWNAKAIASVLSPSDLVAELEGYYRGKILAIKNLQNNAVKLGLDLSGGLSIVIRADIESLEKKLGKTLSAQERADAVNRAIEVLNSKIDKFGLTEPVIRQQGTEHIYVEIPGAADPERINSIIMGRGRLAFHIVNEEASQVLAEYLQKNPTGITENNVVADPNVIPPGYVVRKVYKKDAYGLDEWTGQYRVITETAGLDGNHIKDAAISSDPITGQPTVVFHLDPEGGEIFYKLTTANIKKRMAVVLDDRIKSEATISEGIRDSVMITGFNQEEAQNLSLILRTGALPVELIVESQQAIGSSLGEDAIRQGKNAIIVAIILVIGFMIIYYKGAGINAAFAQVLNLYFILSILSAFNLTLTLPAIAGFVLTLGMAVDANVIIFERIKEELRQGKGRKASIEAGFQKAFWAIMDSNVTTIIAALFLAQLGTGPIKGFAITLAIGNMSSLFTSLFVSRLMFDFTTDITKSEKVSISWRIK